MIFHDCEAVRDGKKTQTRRVKGKFERLILISDTKTVVCGWVGRLKWQVGRTYAVQPGMSKSAVGRFELLDIREERVQDISRDDARAEGIGHPDFDDEISGSCLGGIAGGCDACANCDPVWYFRLLWDGIWKGRPKFQWKANPPVWALTIRWVG